MPKRAEESDQSTTCSMDANKQSLQKKFGIQHTFTPPYHPQSNGQAERFVDTFKRAMKKCSKNDKDWAEKALLSYRTTPNATSNGYSPDQLFFGRKLRTKMSLVHPRGEPIEHIDHEQIRKAKREYASKMSDQFDKKHGAKHTEFRLKIPQLFESKYRSWEEGLSTGTHQLRRRLIFDDEQNVIGNQPMHTDRGQNDEQQQPEEQPADDVPQQAVRRSHPIAKPRQFYSPSPIKKRRR
ncbi:hypothetical protein niasHT_028588 [Heterodera trifolii]|uniref:Integrase catalytic domain-containing protein n=1 Tax=Heterodera trifolii TaxID=157864 RepID=A0ABD2KA54_9BILA